MRKKKTLYKWIIFAVVVLLVGYLVFGNKSETGFTTADVVLASVEKTVQVSGKVEPAQSADLGFERSGRISWVGVSAGKNVQSGKVLATIYSGEAVANREQSVARLRSEEAQLAQLLKGTKVEEIGVYETKVENAEIAVDLQYRSLYDKMREAYTVSDEAIHKNADQMFSNAKGVNPSLDIQSASQSDKTEVEFLRSSFEALFVSWKPHVADKADSSLVIEDVTATEENLQKIRSFLDALARIVNSLDANSQISQTTVDAYVSSISAARTNVLTVISSLRTSYNDYRTKESALALAKKELVLAKTGATLEEIEAKQASIAEAQAQISLYDTELSKYSLIAPFSGTVKSVDAKVGEIADAGRALVSIISDAKYEIEAFVPEVDVAILKIGQKAKTTMDAYGKKEIFSAVISNIDPAETVIDGVSTYKTTFQFELYDARIRSGMTADIDILIESKDDVVVVPQRAVIEDGDRTYVRVANDDGTMMEKDVVIGLKGSEGLVEVVSGLIVGEKVITFLQ